MRRRLITLIPSVLLTCALFLGGAVQTASAQSADDVVGSWLLELAGEDAPPDDPTTPALATFFADGTLVASDLPARPEPAAASPAVLRYATAGHGVWTATSPSRVALTYVELVFDATGSISATLTLSATVRIDESGDAMSGPYAATSVGPDGQALTDLSGTLEGTRIKIALIADFIGSQEAGTFDVVFEDRSTGDSDEWRWDFGDGRTGSRQDPVHTYAEPGEYRVTLTVTKGDSEATRTRTVTVAAVDAPTADFRGDQDDDSLAVRFTDASDGDPDSWRWDFGDGRTGSRREPTHTYAEPGEYEVTLTVRNVGGSDSRTRTITVEAVPTAVADFTAEQEPSTLAVHFSDDSTGKPTGWSWDFGDGRTGSRRNPTHTYAEAGEYEVTLTVENAAGSDAETMTVTVEPQD